MTKDYIKYGCDNCYTYSYIGLNENRICRHCGCKQVEKVEVEYRRSTDSWEPIV